MDEGEPASIESLLAQARTGMQDHSAKCCCGRPQCAFLAHNSAALEGLEQDLVSAAQIGQALLLRHESHMAESEAERIRMDATIDRLEDEKQELEASNARTIEENRMLLDQLEELNHQVGDSDSQIQSLTASLQATQQELQRLTVLTQRTTALEAQLFALESEHAQLQSEMITTEEGQRSAVQRWRRAEATISQLQEQIDRIEREGKEERERHIEMAGRMERTRRVEKELDTAAGRLKGAAAASTLGRYQPGTSVVSHFVRDILQDNANLQSGVVELRELLMGSNAEVEHLREQLRVHRPLDENEGALTTLQQELKDHESHLEPSSATPDASSALHVHHHYHAPNITVRKPKKKRPSISITTGSSASGMSTPRTSRVRDWRASTSSMDATILAHTSASLPPSHQQRWSMQSTNTLSSFSSGPSSPHHTGSVFDPLEGPPGISLPTTPASSVPGSPSLDPSDITPRKPVVRSTSGPLNLQLKSSPSLGNIDIPRSTFEDGNTSKHSDVLQSPFGTETILEEAGNYHDEPYDNSFLAELSPTRRIRRAASHESLISVSGMDIHTLRGRPSQLLFGGHGQLPLSPQAAMTHETAIIRPGLDGRGSSGGDHARSLLHSMHQAGSANRPSLTQKVGGWVWGKWSASPAMTPPTEAEPSPLSPPRPPLNFNRSFGINQRGPIPGLAPPKRAPIRVETQQVDGALLRESLRDGALSIM